MILSGGIVHKDMLSTQPYILRFYLPIQANSPTRVSEASSQEFRE